MVSLKSEDSIGVDDPDLRDLSEPTHGVDPIVYQGPGGGPAYEEIDASKLYDLAGR